MTLLDDDVRAIADAALSRAGRVLVLTGAGISAASGIPTFRGPEGYWSVGSRVYEPQQIATQAMFARDPEAVWGWYLYRLGVCRAAAPNPAHTAIVTLEQALGDRFLLVTQNVDGLHQRAGSSRQRCYPVHGHLERMRCAAGCTADLYDLPADVEPIEREQPLRDAHRALLVCPRCGGWTRPHVLWFDESYDEAYFRFSSSLAAAQETTLLLTVGTSGATNLPNLVVRAAVSAGAVIIDVNPEANPFGDLAARLPAGACIRAPATDAVPALVDHLVA